MGLDKLLLEAGPVGVFVSVYQADDVRAVGGRLGADLDAEEAEEDRDGLAAAQFIVLELAQQVEKGQ